MEQTLQENCSLWELFEVITLLKSEEECAHFFRDLCTINELAAMAERWEIAKLIEEGIPYRKISEITGASTTTITRIAHWLKYGEGGYELMLKRWQDLQSSNDSGH
jgi:TrpR-related protein YerC/YecD